MKVLHPNRWYPILSECFLEFVFQLYLEKAIPTFLERPLDDVTHDMTSGFHCCGPNPTTPLLPSGSHDQMLCCVTFHAYKSGILYVLDACCWLIKHTIKTSVYPCKYNHWAGIKKTRCSQYTTTWSFSLFKG